MINIQPLTHDTLKPYLLLSQTGYRHWLLDSHKEKGLIILGASFWGHPVGFLLAQYGEKNVYLLDLYVQPEYRRAGIATKLLTTLEAQVSDAGVPRIQANYQANQHTPAFHDFLASQQWMQPIHSRNIVGIQCSSELEKKRWVTAFPFRPPFEAISWVDVTDEQKQAIRQRGEKGWYPEGLSPFHRPTETWDAKLSVALRCRDEILGWVLVFRESAEQIMVDIMFVDPPLQPLGRGIMLVAEMMRRTLADGVDFTYWGIAPDNAPMLRWTREAFEGMLLDEQTEWFSEKVLGV